MVNPTTLSQLTPGNCIFVLINYQTKLAFTINSENLPPLINNAVRLAKIARTFEIPTLLTTICADSFGGPLLSSLQMVFPDQDPIDCNKLNVWESGRASTALKKIGRKKLVMAGLWTDFSVAVSAIQALRTGYDVYIATDACAELSDADNDMAVQKMIEAGAVPLDSSRILLHFKDCQQPSKPGRGLDSDWVQETLYS
jgi:nicotinamidase-related amidase